MAVALIAAAILLAVGGHISVNHTLAQLKQDLTDALANNASTESVARLISFWEQQKTKLSYFVEHEYLATLNDAFADLKIARKNEDLQKMETDLHKIILLVEQLLETEKNTVGNFF